MVNDELWISVCKQNKIKPNKILCSTCFESLLGRKLLKKDLNGDNILNRLFWLCRTFDKTEVEKLQNYYVKWAKEENI